jgi:hypothetical protein
VTASTARQAALLKSGECRQFDNRNKEIRGLELDRSERASTADAA